MKLWNQHNRGGRIALILFLLLLISSNRGLAASFTAYSLKEAEHRLVPANEPAARDDDLMSLGGITRLVGMVYVADKKDIILVGETETQERSLTLDDLVVAMKALMVSNQWPLVSIDASPETASNQQQLVRFEGGVENSCFGKAMLEADVCLKELALGKRSAEKWGIKSYFDRLVETARKTGSPGPGNIRFWFEPIDPKITALDQVYVINELRIGVSAKFSNGNANIGKNRDAVAEAFASDFTGAFGHIATAFSEVARLKQLFALTAVAQGIQSLPSAPVEFWVHRYKLRNAVTPNTFPVLSREQEVQGSRNMVDLKLSGGVKLNALVLRLRDGDATALYDAVVQSRPALDTLNWKIPLDGWAIPGAGEELLGDASSKPNGPSGQTPAGCAFVRSISLNGGQFVGPAIPAYEELHSVQRDPSVQKSGSLPQGGTKILWGDGHRSGGTLPMTSLPSNSALDRMHNPVGPATAPPVKGVSMKETITDDSLTTDTSGELDKTKDSTLKSRPGKDSLFWKSK